MMIILMMMELHRNLDPTRHTNSDALKAHIITFEVTNTSLIAHFFRSLAHKTILIDCCWKWNIFFAGPARGRRGPVERFLHISHNLQDHFNVTCHTDRFHVHLWLQRPFSLSSLHLESGRGFFWISKLWNPLNLILPALVTLMKRITLIESNDFTIA